MVGIVVVTRAALLIARRDSTWIVDSFHQAVRLKAIHQLGDIGAHAGELLGQLAETHRVALGHQEGQSSMFRTG